MVFFTICEIKKITENLSAFIVCIAQFNKCVLFKEKMVLCFIWTKAKPTKIKKIRLPIMENLVRINYTKLIYLFEQFQSKESSKNVYY